ncbi:hypothetical protein [Bradyrhizobium shewense]|uniref:hypothetical protein n=1 Tax=Bradyrhizobium shewense TaxID=1761772 RepID=UPI00101AD415|nr:hypothetical protein [Bradyrhizobium shewense]
MFPLVLAGVAFALSFAIPDRALRFGSAVGARFLERGDNIPPAGTPPSAASLKLWLEPNASAAKGMFAWSYRSMSVSFFASVYFSLLDLMNWPRAPARPGDYSMRCRPDTWSPTSPKIA